jgi:hypothetical protein
MTCGDKENETPCDLAMGSLKLIPLETLEEERKNPPPPHAPKDQFQPATDLTVTRIAEFQCTQTHYAKVFRPYGMEGEDERVSGTSTMSQNVPVTIKVIPNESPAKTEDRFEQAAEIELRGMLFRKEMSDCDNHRFARFLPTAQEVLGVQTKMPEAGKCDGEWASHSVCRK